jgi:hypothetical protein
MAINRKLLEQELARAGQITQSAVSGEGFDPRGGYGVLAAQLGTAAIGAFAEKKARDKLMQQEELRKQKMGAVLEKQGLSPDLADLMSPASQDALVQQIIKSELTTPAAPKYDIREGEGGFVRIDPQTGTAEPIKTTQGEPLRSKVKEGKAKDLELSEGQKAADKEFAKEYVDFRAKGGYADVKKQMLQLRAVSDDLLNSKKNLTGPGFGFVPDTILAFTNPDALSTKQRVEEVVQRNLRLILGAQFTQKEGERLITRAYDERLPEKENAKRVNSLIEQMDKAARSKESASRYFEEKGTLKGWKGKKYTLSDFNKKLGIKEEKKLEGISKEDSNIIDFNNL